MARRPPDPTRAARRLLNALPSDSGFAPSALVAFAYTDLFLDGKGVAPQLRRAFRFEIGGSATEVSVEGALGSTHARSLVDRLQRGGYEQWRTDSESVHLRRWIHGARERRGELRFLAELGVTGTPRRWPTRTRSTGAAPLRLGRPSRERWLAILDEIGSADVTWHEVTLGFTRQDVVTSSTLGALRVQTNLLATHDLGDDQYLVMVGPARPGDGTWRPARALAAQLRAAMKNIGYREPRWSGSAKGKRLVIFCRDATTVTEAVRAAKHAIRATCDTLLRFDGRR